MMNHNVVELDQLITKNKEWLTANADRRNTVYYQMVENTLIQLEQHLDFVVKFHPWNEA